MNSHAHDSNRSEALPALASWYTQGRSDGLGDRLLMTDNTGAESLELLRFHPAFAGAFGFERALREQVERLDRFHHEAFSRVRAVEYLEDGDGLALVSTHVAGTRLADMFRSPRLRPALNPAFATWLLRQLTSAVADLQALGRGVAHGALTADRIILTPERHVVIVEHVVGPAIEGLSLSPSRLWADIGIIANSAPAGPECLGARSDVVQIGLMILSVVLGRRITPDEYPVRLGKLLDELSIGAQPFALVAPLRLWIERALRVDGHGFRNAREARDGLGELPGDAGHRQLDRFDPADRSYVGPSVSSGGPDPADTEDGERRPAIVVPIHSAPAAAAPLTVVAPVVASDAALAPPPAPEVFPTPASGVKSKPPLAIVFGVVAALEAAAIVGLLYTRPVASASTAPPLTIDSPHAGDIVMIDGREAGVTPFLLQETLKSGANTHTIRVMHPDAPTEPMLPAIVELKAAVPAKAGEPQAAALEEAAARQKSGGVKLLTPIELQVFEGDRVLGSSADGPIVASAGTHELELVNNALGFRLRQTVTFKAGQFVSLTVTPPNGRLNVNAQPWAQVLIDGNPMGETPLANLPVALGEHEVVLRHPQFGDRREKVLVRAGSVTRVSAVLGK
jgi:hypothetical protein